jgi:hypothetical protein
MSVDQKLPHALSLLARSIYPDWPAAQKQWLEQQKNQSLSGPQNKKGEMSDAE